MRDRRKGEPPKQEPPGPPTAAQIVMTAQLQMAVKLLEFNLRSLADEIAAVAKGTPALQLGPPAGPPAELPPPPDGVPADLLIVRSGKDWKVIASKQGLPTLSVAEDASEEGRRDAEWVIHSVDQRGATLEKFGHALAMFFPEFIEKGGPLPKPHRSTRFSDSMQLHETTVKRLVMGKRLQLAHGVYPLEAFLVVAPAPRP